MKLVELSGISKPLEKLPVFINPQLVTFIETNQLNQTEIHFVQGTSVCVQGSIETAAQALRSEAAS